MLEQISAVLLGRQDEINGLRVNFFAEQYGPDTLPFAILGKQAPPAVTGAYNGGSWTDPTTGIEYDRISTVDPSTFLKTKGRDGAPHPYLNDPSDVVTTIGVNLEKIFDTAIAGLVLLS